MQHGLVDHYRHTSSATTFDSRLTLMRCRGDNAQFVDYQDEPK